MKKIKDNPNPRATIGFVCYVPLNYFVYKNVYKHLRNAEFIVGDTYDMPSFGLTSNQIDTLITFFQKQHVYWRYFDVSDTKENQAHFFDKYDVLVSTWYRGVVKEKYNADKRLVRMMYGQAKDLWNFGPWSAYFDLILTTGTYAQKFLSVYTKSIIVGNPKFDEWFQKRITHSATLTIQKKIDKKKKTLLYLPTHGLLSSLPIMAAAIEVLSLHYNVLVKMHHITNLYDLEIVSMYHQSTSCTVFSDEDDILPLLKVSDVVISDNSGAIFDAVLADKPIVLLDFVDKTHLSLHGNNYYYNVEGKHLGVATTVDSMEQVIKRPKERIGPVLVMKQKSIDVRALKTAIKNAMHKESVYKKKRRKIRNVLFAKRDGNSGKRAADHIQKLLKSPKPQKSFMAQVIDRYREYFI